MVLNTSASEPQCQVIYGSPGIIAPQLEPEEEEVEVEARASPLYIREVPGLTLHMRRHRVAGRDGPSGPL